MNGTWTTLDIAGKPADVYDLAAGVKPRFGILFLHPSGLETLRDRTAFTRLFDELRLTCVCPMGLLSWWADRVFPPFDPERTPERHVVEHVLHFFAARWGLRERSVGLLGISMGGQGALRIAFRHPDLFPAVAAISPAIEYHELYGQGYNVEELYDSKEQCRQDTVPMHIHPSRYPPYIGYWIDPDDQPWYRGCDRLHEKLNALGVPHTIDLTTRAGGHSWDYFNRMAEPALRFLVAGLEEESRRLL
jgi:pimeloyl-ACP methyl ester carboxylesterase